MKGQKTRPKKQRRKQPWRPGIRDMTLAQSRESVVRRQQMSGKTSGEWNDFW